MSEHEYVTNDAWLRQVGRPDAIDEIADQFERPVARGVEAFWTAASGTRWPRTPRGWRSMERTHQHTLERKVG
ncbi:MAG: hypothetical protein QOG01_4071 [Pseudonocardiales bacterium]|jgi:hypothetical protein|nr:hypothetical protein [Pseudonocardiales bacterium]